MSEPEWVTRSVVDQLHDEQIKKNTGLEGTRDEGLLESALNNPKNAYFYDNETDIYKLATIYVFSIAANHAYNDGNKRTAFITASTFLYLNNVELNVDDESIITMMPKVGEGKISKDEFAQWLAENSKEIN